MGTMEVFTRLESEVRLYSRDFPVVFARGDNERVYDEEGREYIDFFNGAGALNYGHNNPRMTRALVEYLQAGGILHSLDMATVAKRRFFERFEQVVLVPRGLRYKVQTTGPTGTNSVEAALKLVRKVTGRSRIVGFFNAFHGLTLGSLALTGAADKRGAAGVELHNAVPMPFEGFPRAGSDSLAHLETYLEGCAGRADLPAAVILETVQAEGGIRVASRDWLRAVAALARRYGVLLIVDDIQAGCGRTGDFFSFEEAGIEPDLVCLSKSIGGLGLPMSIVLIKPEHDLWKPGEHTSTFRGNNLAFVAAAEALSYWEGPEFGREVVRKGELTRARLRALAARHPGAITDVRGRGLLNGLELARPDQARQVVQAAFRRGLVIETTGPASNVIKLLPPLTIEDPHLDRGLEILAESVEEVLAGAGASAAGPAAAEAPAPAPAAPADVPAGLAARLRRVAARVAGRPEAAIPDDRPLLGLGLDSLAMVELQHGIEQELGVSLPVAELLDGIDLAGVARLVRAALAAGEQGAAPPGGGGQTPAPAAPGEPFSPAARAPRSVPLTASSGEEVALSPGQAALWMVQRLAGESGPLHIAAAASVLPSAGRRLDAALLGRGLAALAERHPILFAAFAERDDGPVLLPGRGRPPELVEVDATAWSEPELGAWTESEAYRPFDLAAGPLLRLAVARRPGGEDVVVLAIHHLAADLWSVAMLVRDLSSLYLGAALPPLALTYADHLRRQAERLATAAAEPLWAWWREQLAAAPAPLALPYDRPRPVLRTFRGSAAAAGLGPDLSVELRSLARRSGATLFATLLAGFQALLGRECGQDDLLVGSPAAGRTRPDLADLAGYFVNLLALRADLGGDPSFAALVGQARRRVQGALAHQELPFPWVAERLLGERDTAGGPALEAGFVLQQAPGASAPRLAAFALGEPGGSIGLGGVALASRALPERWSQFDLVLRMAEVDGSLVASLQYGADRFDRSTALRMLGHLRELLSAAAGAPEQPLSTLGWLAAAERHQVLAEWNDTARVQSAEPWMHEQVGAQARRRPGALAVEGPAGSLSYGELDRLARGLARTLRGLGVGREVRAGVCLERSPEQVVANLAVLHAGGAYVALDPSHPDDRLDFQLADSRIAVLLARPGRLAGLAAERGIPCLFPEEWAAEDRALEHRMADAAAPEPRLAGGALPAAGLEPAADPSSVADLPPAALSAENLAYVIYTSGTTGRPKGVEISHGGLCQLAAVHRRLLRVGEADRSTLLAGVGFDAAVAETWTYLSAGASLHVPPDALRSDPAGLRDWMCARGITVNFLPTALAEGFFDLDWSGEPPPLRAVLAAGDRLLRYPPETLPFELINAYGPTEAAVITTAGAAPAGGRPGQPPTIGRPLDGIRTLVVEMGDGAPRPVPVGVPGELLIGGAGLARGYLGRPDLTAERFVPDPFATDTGARLMDRDGAPGARLIHRNGASGVRPIDWNGALDARPIDWDGALGARLINWDGALGARLYRTGDLVRWSPEGEIEFLGRVDRQVKVRGHRIELGEIEAVLAGHPQVAAVAVLAEAGRLVAFVAPRAETAAAHAEPRPAAPGAETAAPHAASIPAATRPASPAAAVLRDFARRRLPEPMVPALYVSLPALPLNSSGKVDRQALARLAGSASTAAGAAGADPGRALTPVEELLAGLWRELLGVERIGPDDDFFVLGGHSLAATRLRSRVRSAFGIDLPLESLFAAPTLARQAEQVDLVLRRETGAAAPPIVRVPRDADLPLSFAQQRLWFLDQLAPGTAVYNIPLVADLAGPLAAGALARSLAAVVRRHEALRTTFPETAAGTVQRIAPAPPLAASLPLPVADLSGLPAAARTPELARLSRAEARRPFDLARGPLLRAALLRAGAAHHVLILAMHHVVSDGWSVGVLVRELSAFYRGFTAGRAWALGELPALTGLPRLSELPALSELSDPPVLPELPVQYADYAAWQRRWLAGEVLATQMGYWRRQLAGLPAIELPTDRPRPAVETFRGGFRPLAIDAGLTARLGELAHRSGTTLYMVLLAAFDALLAAWSGRSDVVVGSPVANRNRHETEGLIGFFVNTLVMRTSVGGDPAFGALLGRVRETALAAYVHEDLPFEKLVEELQPERDMSRNPLVQAMLALQNTPLPPLDLPGLTVTPRLLDLGISKVDLDLVWWEEQGRLAGMVEFSTALFDAATALRLAAHYEALLARAAAAPELPVSALAGPTEAERHQIVEEWNDTRGAQGERRETVPRCCVHEWVERQVAATPGATALVAGDAVLTYAELNARANRLAHHLRRLGVGPDRLVGICVDRTSAMVVSLLAVLKAGGAALALDPTYPEERLRYVIGDAGLAVLLADEKLLGLLPDTGVPRLRIDADGPLWAGESDANPASGVEPEHTMYAIYTSGSTGLPKGVSFPHRAFVNLLAWQLGESPLAPRARTLQYATFGFCVSFLEIFSVLCSGATLVMVPEERRRDMDALWSHLEEHEVERLHLPFAALKQLADSCGEQQRMPRRLREIVTSGEQLQIGGSLRALFSRLAGCALHNQYGTSEIHVVSSCQLGGPPGGWPDIAPVGRPVANSQVYLLDAHLQPLPVGVAGELYAGGACLARGYLGSPGQTAAKFVPDPFAARRGEAGARLYRTGDLARYLPDGRIEWFGRIDSQVRIRGFRVELGEVEVAVKQHPEVRNAAVLCRPGPQGDPRLIAYVVPHAGSAVPAELRAFLKTKLPEHMVPALYVAMAALPLNANGKLDLEAFPDPEIEVNEATFVGPRDAVEEVVADIMGRILGRPRIGVHDNFFSLGGHSLLATQVANQVRRTFGVNLPLRAFFEGPTVAELARAVEARETKPGRSAKVARAVLTVRGLSAAELEEQLRVRKAS